MRFSVLNNRGALLAWDDTLPFPHLEGAEVDVTACRQLVRRRRALMVPPTGPEVEPSLTDPVGVLVVMIHAMGPQGLTISGQVPEVPGMELPDGAIA